MVRLILNAGRNFQGEPNINDWTHFNQLAVVQLAVFPLITYILIQNDILTLLSQSSALKEVTLTMDHELDTSALRGPKIIESVLSAVMERQNKIKCFRLPIMLRRVTISNLYDFLNQHDLDELCIPLQLLELARRRHYSNRIHKVHFWQMASKKYLVPKDKANCNRQY